MVRVIFVLFALFSFSFGNDDININSLEDLSKFAPQKETDVKKSNKRIPITFSSKEIEKKDSFSLDDLDMLAPTNESELDRTGDVYQSVKITKLTLKAENAPKKVYVNQIFKIDFIVYLGQKVSVTPNLQIDKTESLKWLNAENLTWINGEDMLEATLWFEASDKNAKINDMTLVLNRNGEFFQEASIKPQSPEFIDIAKKDNYANIAADELKVKDYKTTKFDDNSNLLTLNLSVKNANLSSFHLENPNILKQGVDSIRGNYANQNGYYFAVFDNNITKFDFSYFNLQTKKMENFSVDARAVTEDLSTQIGLNPKESKFKIYKDIAIYSLAALLVVMFIASKNITPLIFAGLVLAVNFYFQKPEGNGVLNEKTAVKILPIANSTIFYVTQKSENAEILDANNEYYKILLENGKIGWVKKNDIRKN
ncbi:MAG: hypothetical protein J6M21_01625 [Campylobacter sp.]|nr:hypothetical protein [Campylobacter sp.]